MYLKNGILVQDYMTDSGAFKSNSFVKHIHETHQIMRFCVTNAHHQNGVSERAIQTISNMARSMILHASMHWKDGIYASLWPQAMTYATHVYNTTRKDGVFPADIFFGSAFPRHRLMDLHVWECPVYVLYPKIQQGQKLPRWAPMSKRGMFLGLSQQHASEVPLVLNLVTGSITTKFHVVFDDLFTTAPSIEMENEAPEHWAELCLENSTHLMLDSPPEHFNYDWLTAEELEIKRHRQNRDEIIREATEQIYGASSVLHPGRVTGATEVPSNTPTSNDQTEDTTSRIWTPIISNRIAPTPETEGAFSPTEGVTNPSGGGELRRSTCSTAGKFKTARYADVFLARVEDYENQ
jgi:hypothetical protein